MRRGRIRYSAAELAFVESNKATPRRELHALFVATFGRSDITYDDIKGLCSRRGWALGRQRWSPDDDAQLRELYPNMQTAEIGRRLGRSLLSTYNRAQKLGLEKTEEYLASPEACRLRRGDNVGAAHRFPKGHAPANKGLRRPGWSPGRMKATQFTPGQNGWNWKPIGSERIIDGYRYTKVSDVRRVKWSVNWKPTHILRWEALHGPLAAGHVLKSLDGDKLNVDPANWESVPRALLPRLNGGPHGRSVAYNDAPGELKPTILAIAKLEHATREVRRKPRTASSA